MVRLTSFDLYPKTLKEFKQRTLTGAIVSVACAALIAILTVVEIADYAQVRTHDHLSVDISRGQQMRINLNITFPALPCSVLTLEVLDLSGNHLPDTRRHIQKTRLDVRGAPLPGGQLEPERRRGPVIIGMPGASRRMLAVDDGAKRGTGGGAKPVAELNLPSLDLLSKPDTLLSELLSQMLPQIFEDKEAIDELQRHVGEGCHIEGHLMVNRVAGRFHFSLTHADHHTLLKVFQTRESLNVSHVIHTLSFGEPYPGMVNPLDDIPKLLDHGSGYFQYYIKVVPTVYESLWGSTTSTNQFSYTELFRTTQEVEKLPAVSFHYEISPIMARISRVRKSLGSFLTGLCAIVGGVFTVAGMIDAAIYRAGKLVSR